MLPVTPSGSTKLPAWQSLQILSLADVVDLIDGGDGGVHDGEVLVMDGSHALKKEIVEVYNDYQKVNGLKTKTKWNGYNRKQHVVEERNLLLSCLARANTTWSLFNYSVYSRSGTCY